MVNKELKPKENATIHILFHLSINQWIVQDRFQIYRDRAEIKLCIYYFS